MFDSAIYYIEAAAADGRFPISHDGARVASFASRDDAARLAMHLATIASEMGLHGRVIDRGFDRKPMVIFDRAPIPETDLPWEAVTA